MSTEAENNAGTGKESTNVVDDISIDNLFGSGGNLPPKVIKEESKKETTEAGNKDEKESESSKQTQEENSETGKNTSEKETTEKEVLEYTQDKEGNLLDENGKIVATKEDYEVDKDGNISFTGESDEDDPLKELLNLAKSKGVVLEDDEGNPLEFDTTPESMYSFAETVGEQMIDTYEARLLAEYPVISDIVNHIKAGNSLDDFYKSQLEVVNYSEIKLKEEDTAQHKKIVKDYLTVVGNLAEEDAEENIKLYEDAGALKDKATVWLEKLKEYQNKVESDKREADKAAILAQQEAANRHWNEINNIITSRKLGNLEIPETDTKPFFEFLTAKNEEGVSKYAEKYKNLSQDKKLMLDYLLYKDLSLNDLVSMQVNKNKVEDLRKRKVKLKSSAKPARIIKSTTAAEADYSLGNLT